MCAIYFRSSPFTSKVPKNDVKLESFESEENCVCMRGKLFICLTTQLMLYA